MLKLTRLSTVGGNDPMPLTLGAPIPKANKAPTPAALTAVPGKPYLFKQANGAMAYLPPEPRVAAAHPALAAPYGQDTSPACGFVPQPGVWREDTPAKPGWYCASNRSNVNMRRHWNGEGWSSWAEDTATPERRAWALRRYVQRQQGVRWRDDIACDWE